MTLEQAKLRYYLFQLRNYVNAMRKIQLEMHNFGFTSLMPAVIIVLTSLLLLLQKKKKISLSLRVSANFLDAFPLPSYQLSFIANCQTRFLLDQRYEHYRFKPETRCYAEKGRRRRKKKNEEILSH